MSRCVFVILLLANLLQAQDMPLSQILIDGEGWRLSSLKASAVKGLHGITGGPDDCRYESDPEKQQIVKVSRDGKRTTVATGEAYHGLVLTPDGGTLVAGASEGNALWAFRVEKDGTLTGKDAYFALRVPPGKKVVSVGPLTVDRVGRVYAATGLGIQVFDPTGRLCGVLVPPSQHSPLPSALSFGGDKGDELLVAWGDKLHARTLKTRGLNAPR
jgi:enterochelin esterase family protein